MEGSIFAPIWPVLIYAVIVVPIRYAVRRDWLPRWAESAIGLIQMTMHALWIATVREPWESLLNWWIQILD